MIYVDKMYILVSLASWSNKKEQKRQRCWTIGPRKRQKGCLWTAKVRLISTQITMQFNAIAYCFCYPFFALCFRLTMNFRIYECLKEPCKPQISHLLDIIRTKVPRRANKKVTAYFQFFQIKFFLKALSICADNSPLIEYLNELYLRLKQRY